MRKYRLVAKKGEGTFSEVLKAQNIKDSKYHAIKCMKNHFESIDQVNNLREIQALRRLSPHPHIVKLEEVLYDQPSGRLALVFELMDANLYELIRGRRHYLKHELIRSFMYQLVKSLDHMHSKGIFHRDIKPENILVDNSTDLKLADFGSCRGIYSKQPYTEYISTRWYRAPECLLTDGYYGPEMDLWGVGCVFFEITSLYPLFPGSNELDQINRIHKILGTPSPDVLDIFKRKGAAHLDFNFPTEEGTSIAKLIPHAPPEGVDLMCKMLSYDPSKRINAKEALRHVYFRELREREAAKVVPQSLAMHGGTNTTTKPLRRHKESHDKNGNPLPNLHGDVKSNSQISTKGSHSTSKVTTKVSTLGTNNEMLPPIGNSIGNHSYTKGNQHKQTMKKKQYSYNHPTKSKSSNLYVQDHLYTGSTSKYSKNYGQHSNIVSKGSGMSIKSYSTSKSKNAGNPYKNYNTKLNQRTRRK